MSFHTLQHSILTVLCSVLIWNNFWSIQKRIGYEIRIIFGELNRLFSISFFLFWYSISSSVLCWYSHRDGLSTSLSFLFFFYFIFIIDHHQSLICMTPIVLCSSVLRSAITTWNCRAYVQRKNKIFLVCLTFFLFQNSLTKFTLKWKWNWIAAKNEILNRITEKKNCICKNEFMSLCSSSY